MLTERDLAEALFRQTFGVDPPSLPRWDEIENITTHNDGRYKDLYEFDREQWRLNLYLHEGQQPAWDSTARFVFMIAGKQSGKTIFGPAWLYREIQKQGKGDYLAVSATYELFKLKMLPEIKKLFVMDLKIARYWAGDRLLELCDPETGEFGAEYSHEHEKMWGRVILRSADSEEGLQSASAKAAWMDEPGLYGSGVFKDIRGRLALAEGRALGTTTPYNMGWLKQQIYDPWVAGDEEIEVIQFSSRLSPFFSDAEYASLQRSMQDYQFKMDYDAEFGRPPAAIYEDFIDALIEDGGHKCKRFVIPKDWPHMVSIDPGVVNPGKLWIAYDAANDVYYCHLAEKGGQRRTSKEHARYDLNRAKERLWRVIWWAIGAKSEKYWREDYKNAGANGVKEPVVVDVWEGIDRVTHLIKEHRFYVFDDQTEFIAEIMSYARVIKNGEVINEIKDKSTYHLMDALRYFAQQVVKKPAMRAEFGSEVRRYV